MMDRACIRKYAEQACIDGRIDYDIWGWFYEGCHGFTGAFNTREEAEKALREHCSELVD